MSRKRYSEDLRDVLWLYFRVAPFLRDSNDVVDSTLSGSILVEAHY